MSRWEQWAVCGYWGRYTQFIVMLMILHFRDISISVEGLTALTRGGQLASGYRSHSSIIKFDEVITVSPALQWSGLVWSAQSRKVLLTGTEKSLEMIVKFDSSAQRIYNFYFWVIILTLTCTAISNVFIICSFKKCPRRDFLHQPRLGPADTSCCWNLQHWTGRSPGRWVSRNVLFILLASSSDKYWKIKFKKVKLQINIFSSWESFSYTISDWQSGTPSANGKHFTNSLSSSKGQWPSPQGLSAHSYLGTSVPVFFH